MAASNANQLAAMINQRSANACTSGEPTSTTTAPNGSVPVDATAAAAANMGQQPVSQGMAWLPQAPTPQAHQPPPPVPVTVPIVTQPPVVEGVIEPVDYGNYRNAPTPAVTTGQAAAQTTTTTNGAVQEVQEVPATPVVNGAAQQTPSQPASACVA